MEELNHVIAKKAEESKKEFIHTKSLDFDNQTKSRYFFFIFKFLDIIFHRF